MRIRTGRRGRHPRGRAGRQVQQGGDCVLTPVRPRCRIIVENAEDALPARQTWRRPATIEGWLRGFYTDYYAAVERSRAHHEFCERVFGRDLAQHGFADMEQLDLLLEVTGLGSSMRAVDLGCGNGLITEYLSGRTGAHITGVDYIEGAVAGARRRTAAQAGRLDFVAADINRLPLASGFYDLVISIDTAYFADDLSATVAEWARMLRPGGKLAVFYSHGREPWVPLDEFPRDSLPPDRTPLAEALTTVGLAYRTWNLTESEYRLAVKRKVVLAGLEDAFEAEGIKFIFENRMGDAKGISQAIEDGLHARYLYLTGPRAG